MGSVDSGFGSGFEGGFEPDDFYESFLAPKFHDFTAPEEPIDPDAYFLSKPGKFKSSALASLRFISSQGLFFGSILSFWGENAIGIPSSRMCLVA